MTLTPEPSIRHKPGESTWVLYDLSDPEAWSRAGEERRAWGQEFAEIHRPGNDHVVIVYQPVGPRRPT